VRAIPALSVITTRVSPSSIGSGSEAALATDVASPAPNTLAMDSGATGTRRKLPLGTVSRTGPSAWQARLVSIKVDELTAIENSANTLAGVVALS
jgi:hypothetical protein